MTRVSVNQIISAKLLLDTAKRQVKKSGLEKAFSILHTHDALDWILQYLYDSTSSSKKGKMMFFSGYAGEIAKEPDKFGSLDELKCDQLNTMRNNFKHNFVIPNDKQAEEIVVWAEIQIESLVKTYTGKSLSEYDTLDAIVDEDVRKKIKEADQSLKDNKPEHALSNLAIAYAMIERLKRQRVEDMYGVDVPSANSLSFSNSFFLKLEPILGRDFSRAWDTVIENVEYQNAMVPASLLGVDHSEYLQFLLNTPRPQLTLDGKYHVSYSDKYVEQAKKADVSYWREFVINTAISNGL